MHHNCIENFQHIYGDLNRTFVSFTGLVGYVGFGCICERLNLKHLGVIRDITWKEYGLLPKSNAPIPNEAHTHTMTPKHQGCQQEQPLLAVPLFFY
jgi:hypothetical protein